MVCLDLMAAFRSLEPTLETSQRLQANKSLMAQAFSALHNLLIHHRILAAIPLDLSVKITLEVPILEETTSKGPTAAPTMLALIRVI